MALWFIGLDVFERATDEEIETVNLVTHVSGAVIGFFFGGYLVSSAQRTRRERLR
ncbi:MAG: hypothetical protein AB8G17_03260 [Gammaproteobacteria bacterium]